ncbi:MAG TPA: hypothetical protein PLP01_14065 [Phycisphaerae bacterium]|nr:hypothetical protein [Phycisphaerae bacterium]
MNLPPQTLPVSPSRIWPSHVKFALLKAVSLAHVAIVQARGWAASSLNARVRLSARLEQAKAEIALLREEIRIKDARMRAVPAQRRPHYLPTERQAILELKAARGWSLSQTARAFLVTTAPFPTG